MVPKWKDQRGTFGVSLVFVHVAFSLLFFFRGCFRLSVFAKFNYCFCIVSSFPYFWF